MTQEELCTQLGAQFGEAVSALSETKGDRFVTVKGEKIAEIGAYLKTTTGLELDFCRDITAVDWPARQVIEIVYHLYSMTHRHGLVLKVEVNREAPAVATVEGVWKAATWLEREIYDLFGVNFVGHSDMRRLLLPDDWVGYPLRKDYQEAGGYHGIGNTRAEPLVQLAKATDEVRKALASEAAAVAAAAAAAAPPAAEPAVPVAAPAVAAPAAAPAAPVAPVAAPATASAAPVVPVAAPAVPPAPARVSPSLPPPIPAAVRPAVLAAPAPATAVNPPVPPSTERKP
jgi:NADH-quinone oxidoreductase subunit C